MSAQLPVVDRRQPYIEQKIRKCRHFNGTMNQCCEAGIRYDDVRAKNDPPTPYISRGIQYTANSSMPCWVDSPDMNAQNLDCPKRSLFTREEAEADERQMHESFTRIATGRKAIMEFLKEKGELKRDVAGKIPCPNCKTGSLHFRRAGAYNGHIHAKCTTEGCCAWME